MSFIYPVPSLQHLSCVSISKEVWRRHQNELKQACQYGLSQPPPHPAVQLINNVVNIIAQHLVLPDGSKVQLTTCVRAFGEQFLTLLRVYKGIDETLLQHIDIANLTLSGFGVIDTHLLRRALLSINCLNADTRYHLACLTCDDELIRSHIPSHYTLAYCQEMGDVVDEESYWARFIWGIPMNNYSAVPMLFHRSLTGGNPLSIAHFYNLLQRVGFQIRFTPRNNCIILHVESQNIRYQRVLYCSHSSECFVSNMVFFITNIYYTNVDPTPIPADLWFDILCHQYLHREVALAAFEFVLQTKESREWVSQLKTEFGTLHNKWTNPTFTTSGHSMLNNNMFQSAAFDSDCYNDAIAVIDKVLSEAGNPHMQCD